MTSKHYMQTVSALAMGSVAVYAGSATPVDAQDTGFTLTFFGGLGDVAGGLNDFNSGGTPELGQFGGVMLGTSFGGMQTEVSLSYYNQEAFLGSGFGGYGFFPSGGGSGYFYGSGYSGEETSYTALDMNVVMPSGYDERLRWVIGTRLMDYSHSAFGGLEAGYFVSGGSSGDFGVESGASTEFTGLGPRFAARYSTGPIAGQFGFTGELGASLLYGRLAEEVYYAASSGGPGIYASSGYSEMTFATNVDLSLRANYYLSDVSSFYLGYETSQFVGLSDWFDSDGDARTQSVTMGFTTEF